MPLAQEKIDNILETLDNDAVSLILKFANNKIDEGLEVYFIGNTEALDEETRSMLIQIGQGLTYIASNEPEQVMDACEKCYEENVIIEDLTEEKSKTVISAEPDLSTMKPMGNA